jgi:hypothetical protein
MGIIIGQIVVLILILMFPILLCLAIIAACIIIDKWVDIIFYPFEILRDKIDNYRQQRDLESWYKENENRQEDDK